MLVARHVRLSASRRALTRVSDPKRSPTVVHSSAWSVPTGAHVEGVQTVWKSSGTPVAEAVHKKVDAVAVKAAAKQLQGTWNKKQKKAAAKLLLEHEEILRNVAGHLDDDAKTWLLFVACELDSTAPCTALLEEGADCNALTKWGAGGHEISPLHLAARLGHVGTCTALLDAGADVNIPTAAGRTPLATAAQAKKPDVITLLLSRGAVKSLLQSNLGANVRGGMLTYGHPEYVPCNDATKEAMYILPDEDKELALKNAVWYNTCDELEVLLSLGMCPNIVGWMGGIETALEAAARKGNIDACATLLRYGATCATNTKGGMVVAKLVAEGTLSMSERAVGSASAKTLEALASELAAPPEEVRVSCEPITSEHTGDAGTATVKVGECEDLAGVPDTASVSQAETDAAEATPQIEAPQEAAPQAETELIQTVEAAAQAELDQDQAVEAAEAPHEASPQAETEPALSIEAAPQVETETTQAVEVHAPQEVALQSETEPIQRVEAAPQAEIEAAQAVEAAPQTEAPQEVAPQAETEPAPQMVTEDAQTVEAAPQAEAAQAAEAAPQVATEDQTVEEAEAAPLAEIEDSQAVEVAPKTETEPAPQMVTEGSQTVEAAPEAEAAPQAEIETAQAVEAAPQEAPHVAQVVIEDTQKVEVAPQECEATLPEDAAPQEEEGEKLLYGSNTTGPYAWIARNAYSTGINEGNTKLEMQKVPRPIASTYEVVKNLFKKFMGTPSS